MIILIANFLVNIFGLDFAKALRIARWLFLALGVIALLGIIYGILLFRNWRLQNEVERQKEARSQEHQERIDEAKENVNQSANVVNRAIENVNRIENANFTNTNLSEAERLRCKAFPNSKGCK